MSLCICKLRSTALYCTLTVFVIFLSLTFTATEMPINCIYIYTLVDLQITQVDTLLRLAVLQ